MARPKHGVLQDTLGACVHGVLWATFFGGMAIGLAQAVLTPYSSVTSYRSSAPFVLAIVALLIMSRRRVVLVSRATH